MPDKVVLVVEDEQSIAHFINVLLEDAGYRTIVASTGIEALSAVLRIRPHLIVLDIRMPLMSGWSVLEHLQESGYGDVPVIAMSADYLVGADAAHYPICAYLDKPFLPDQLLTLVEQCIHVPDAEQPVEHTP